MLGLSVVVVCLSVTECSAPEVSAFRANSERGEGGGDGLELGEIPEARPAKQSKHESRQRFLVM